MSCVRLARTAVSSVSDAPGRVHGTPAPSHSDSCNGRSVTAVTAGSSNGKSSRNNHSNCHSSRGSGSSSQRACRLPLGSGRACHCCGECARRSAGPITCKTENHVGGVAATREARRRRCRARGAAAARARAQAHGGSPFRCAVLLRAEWHRCALTRTHYPPLRLRRAHFPAPVPYGPTVASGPISFG